MRPDRRLERLTGGGHCGRMDRKRPMVEVPQDELDKSKRRHRGRYRYAAVPVLAERQVGQWMRSGALSPSGRIVVEAQRNRHDVAGDHVGIQFISQVDFGLF